MNPNSAPSWPGRLMADWARRAMLWGCAAAALGASPALFAQEEQKGKRLITPDPSAISEAITGGSRDHGPLAWIFAGIGALLVVVVTVSLSRWLKQQNRSKHPLLLYHHFAKQAGLSWMDEWLVYRLARIRALPTPLTLLICQDTMAAHIEAHARSLPDASARQYRRRMAELKGYLFN